MKEDFEALTVSEVSPERYNAIVSWLETIKERKPKLNPVFEFSQHIPVSQGCYMGGAQFDDGRARIILHESLEDHRRDFEPLFADQN